MLYENIIRKNNQNSIPEAGYLNRVTCQTSWPLMRTRAACEIPRVQGNERCHMPGENMFSICHEKSGQN